MPVFTVVAAPPTRESRGPIDTFEPAADGHADLIPDEEKASTAWNAGQENAHDTVEVGGSAVMSARDWLEWAWERA